MRVNRLPPIIVIAALALAAAACATSSMNDEDLGLSKTSVFDTPSPIVAGTTANEPGENETLEAYFDGAPPVIPHATEDYLPIRIGENLCLDCHELPDEIGQEPAQGDPTPIPASHFTDLRRDPETVGAKTIGSRFVCSQCHAPQSDAAPLVLNTYAQ